MLVFLEDDLFASNLDKYIEREKEHLPSSFLAQKMVILAKPGDNECRWPLHETPVG